VHLELFEDGVVKCDGGGRERGYAEAVGSLRRPGDEGVHHLPPQVEGEQQEEDRYP